LKDISLRVDHTSSESCLQTS